MPGRPNSYEALAEKAAERLDDARAHGRQLSLLGDQEPGLPSEGRAARGKGKALSQMREFLAAKGYRLPEEALAQMAGLASRDDAVLTAMVTAERVIAWAFADKTDKDGNAVKPTAHAFISAFEMAYSVQLRALDALLPYGLAKVSPDGAQAPVVQVNVTSGPSQPADRAAAARDITPRADSRMMPADVRARMQQNQGVSDAGAAAPDSASRTDEASA